MAQTKKENKKSQDYLATEHLQDKLKSRSVKGGTIAVSRQAAGTVMRIGSTAVLARILTPKDFGLVAMVGTVLGFIEMFKTAGLPAATVQSKKLTHDQVSNLFWINVGLGLLLALLTAALSPVIAWIYGQPKLTLITLVLTTTFFLNGFTIQHGALLRRQMKFGYLASVDIISQAAGITAAIIAAVQGLGYWSLVIMTLVQSTTNLILIWIACEWRPGLPKKNTGIKDLVSMGGNLILSRFLMRLRKEFDDVLIGIFYGAGPLAMYTKAYSILLLPIRQINQPMTSVAVSAMSRLQDDPDRYRSFYIQFIQIMVFFGMPLIGFSAVMADKVILTFLGQQWLDAIPIFIALLPAALAGTFNIAGRVVFISMGRTREQLKMDFIASLIICSAMGIAIFWGPIYVAASLSVTFLIGQALIIYNALSKSPIRITDLFISLWKPSIATLTSSILLLLIMNVVQYDNQVPYINLLISLPIFACLYMLNWIVLPGGYKFLNNMYSTIRNIVAQ